MLHIVFIYIFYTFNEINHNTIDILFNDLIIQRMGQSFQTLAVQLLS